MVKVNKNDVFGRWKVLEISVKNLNSKAGQTERLITYK